MYRNLITLAVVSALVAPLAALAQGAPTVAANIGLSTKYKYRGQDQSDSAKAVLPAVQGGFDYESGGLYVGNWNSSVGFLGGTEMDFYAGYRGEINGLGYDVGALYYYYPGSDSSGNTTELYLSASYGLASVKYSTVLSSKYFGVADGRGTGYLELNLSYDVGGGVALVGHLGQTLFSGGAKRTAGAINYSDYKLGAEFDLGSGFTAGAAFVGASKKGQIGDVNKSRLVFTISKAL
jgi:uncharacterized protein (TIGR02001 family)